MRVLAIDTALAACSVAVFDTDRGASLAEETVPMDRGQAEALMPLMAAVVRRAKVAFGELDRVAVTVGPGSFTGLRVGVAAARGIGLAAEKPVVGVTTLAAFAAPHLAIDSAAPLMAVIDARHRHVYMQPFGMAGRAVGQPRIVTLQEAVEAAVPGAARIVGSAAKMIEAAWPKGASPARLVSETAAPEIAWVARLGASATLEQGLPKPLYLRAPDAQPQDAARLPRR